MRLKRRLLGPLLVAAMHFMSNGAEAQDAERFRRNAMRMKEAMESIGIEYEIKSQAWGYEDGQLIRDETATCTIFRNPHSVQISRGVMVSDILGELVPLTSDNVVKLIGKSSFTNIATRTPVPKYAFVSGKEEIMGKYSYVESRDPASYRDDYAPLLVDLSPYGPVRLYKDDFRSVFSDATRKWTALPEASARTFLIWSDGYKSPMQSSLGRNIESFSGGLVAEFGSDDRGIPDRAWSRSALTIDGQTYWFPDSSSPSMFTFDRWVKLESGIEYPMHQVFEWRISDVNLDTLRDESTGFLGQLMAGTLNPTMRPLSRTEIHVKAVVPISSVSSLYFEPMPGALYRDDDTGDQYFVGIDRAESDRLLGLSVENQLPPSPRSYARWMVMATGVLLAVLAAYLVRRKA